MRRHVGLVPGVAVVFLSACVCAPTSSVPDASGSTDGGSAPDAGSRPDAGAETDSGSTDAGSFSDSGTTSDGSTQDSGTIADGGAVSDGGNSPDSGAGPDGGGCVAPFPGSGIPTVVSGNTRPQMDSPLAAYNGTVAMVVWTLSSGGGQSKSVWATLQNGTVVANGDAPVSSGNLFVYQGQFALFNGSLFVFNGTSWASVPSFSGNVISVSGSNILGLTTSAGGGVIATIYDGATVGTAQQISSYVFGAVAPDRAGGFGVVTLDKTSITQTPVHFLTFSGGTWSSETTVTTLPTYIVDGTTVAYGASTWCFAYMLSGTITAWTLTGGTWTSYTFAGQSAYDIRLQGNGSTLALGVAPGTTLAGGWAAISTGGAWTTSVIGTSEGGDIVEAFEPFGSGFLFIFGDNPLTASVYDGTSWGSPATLASWNPFNSTPNVSIGATTAAVGFLDAASYPGPWVPKAAVYSGGAWGAPFTLTSTTTTNTSEPAIALTGNSIVAAYPDTGTVESRLWSAGTWGAPVPLPASGFSGAVRDFTLARAGNGTALALWTQWDIDVLKLYAAEYQGGTWGSPVELLATEGAFSAAANGSTFVVGWVDSSEGRWASTWTGSGLTTPVSLGSFTWSSDWTVRLASDGTQFVAAWDDGSSNSLQPFAATSTDGATWSSPQAIETSTSWSLFDLVGGPAGVVELSLNGTVSARVFQNGAWGPPATMNAGGKPGGGVACHAAVATTSALAACESSGIDAQLFSNGTWTDLPATIGAASSLFTLGTDGADYRVDFVSGAFQSEVLHGSAWSAAVPNTNVNPFPTAPQSDFVAGSCGAWTLIYSGSLSSALWTAQASGTAAYGQGKQILTGQGTAYAPRLVQWPGEVDAVWSGASPTSSGVTVLYVDLGL